MRNNSQLTRCLYAAFAIFLFSSTSLMASSPLIDPFTEESTWINNVFSSKNPLSWNQIDKNRNASPGLPAEGSLGMNIPSSHSPYGFLWNEGDIETPEWYPQGISGRTDQATGERYLAVSWYHKTSSPTEEEKGARITFVDYSAPEKNISYRHVLLVQDKDNGLDTSDERRRGLNAFAPVLIHAGGIAWHQNFLYVVDTNLGIRVFDPSLIFEADSTPSKAHYAFGYKYVMPQIGYYRTHGTRPNSFISLGNIDTGNGYAPALWTGNYLLSDSKQKPAIFGFLLNNDGSIDTFTPPKVVYPKDSNGKPVYNMQGVYRAFGKTWISTTGKSEYEGSTARLVTIKSDSQNGKRWRWPHGAEDLYVDESSGTLWCLTEYPSESDTEEGGTTLPSTRMVFGVDISTY